MITPFGKELRKIRLDRNLLLKDMADNLEFTSSYLSAIENGKKNIPEKLIETLTTLYNLEPIEISKLEIAEMESKTSFEFTPKNESQKDFMVAFARRFDNIPPQKLKKILRDFEED